MERQIAQASQAGTNDIEVRWSGLTVLHEGVSIRASDGQLVFSSRTHRRRQRAYLASDGIGTCGIVHISIDEIGYRVLDDPIPVVPRSSEYAILCR